MDKKAKLNIPGTQPNVTNSQLLVSTGIPAFDFLLGGGAPVGTVILVDEDKFGVYANILLKYFIAEGVVHRHGVLIGSLTCDPQIHFVDQLPDVVCLNPEPSKDVPKDDQLKIAFRYAGVSTRDAELRSDFGNHFDLSRTMDKERIALADVRCFTGDDGGAPDCLFDNAQYASLLGKVVEAVRDERYVLNDNFSVKNVLRVCLHRLGTMLWNDVDDFRDLGKFIFYLRCLMRKSFGVTVVTIPTHVSKKLREVFYSRLIHIADIAIQLETFAGTENEKNVSLSDYHGFFHLVKSAAINTLVSRHPGPVEYVFKTKRKKFCIEKLHLPPDIQDLNDEKKRSAKPSFGCASSTKHLLEF